MKWQNCTKRMELMPSIEKLTTTPLLFSFSKGHGFSFVERRITSFDELFGMIGWHLDICSKVDGGSFLIWGVDSAVRLIREFECHAARYAEALSVKQIRKRK